MVLCLSQLALLAVLLPEPKGFWWAWRAAPLHTLHIEYKSSLWDNLFFCCTGCPSVWEDKSCNLLFGNFPKKQGRAEPISPTFEGPGWVVISHLQPKCKCPPDHWRLSCGQFCKARPGICALCWNLGYFSFRLGLWFEEGKVHCNNSECKTWATKDRVNIYACPHGFLVCKIERLAAWSWPQQCREWMWLPVGMSFTVPGM